MATGRTRLRGTVLLSAILLIAVAVPSFGQDPTLGEIARKEQERRKGTKPPVKVFTNEDLKNGGQPAAEKTPAAPPHAQQAQPESKKSDAKEGAHPAGGQTEDVWRTRMTRARDELRRNEVFATALQSRINALTADFAARDDPYQRAQLADDRQKALAELDRVRTEVENSKKQIADIEEEARKAGVPPGWLR